MTRSARNAHIAGNGKSAAAKVRARLAHPVIDADGHFLELTPVLHGYFLDYAREIGGTDLPKKLETQGGLTYDTTVQHRWQAMSEAQRRAGRVAKPPWWSLPGDTLDRATALLPGLMHERMDALGIDYAVLYPSLALATSRLADDELRRVATRALNKLIAEMFFPYGDRFTPAASIPMQTPEEAVEELRFCVRELGYKAAMLNGVVNRPLAGNAVGAAMVDGLAGQPSAGSGPGATWQDVLALDGAYDYDPLWAACAELKVAVASHAGGQGFGTRRSLPSYVYNHIGAFACGAEAFCKAVFLGGVTRRFPTLTFAYLEGGVGWAVQLYADLMGHWEKRGGAAIGSLDPAKLDTEMLLGLIERYAGEQARPYAAALRSALEAKEPQPPVLDEFAAAGIASKQDVYDQFVPRFYFGCEADDPTIAWAFNTKVNPLGARLRPMFSSDLGHWDVPDMTEVLPEAFELVEHGLITEGDFEELAFANAARLYGTLNPDFFKGTACESQVAALLAKDGAAAGKAKAGAKGR